MKVNEILFVFVFSHSPCLQSNSHDHWFTYYMYTPQHNTNVPDTGHGGDKHISHTDKKLNIF